MDKKHKYILYTFIKFVEKELDIEDTFTFSMSSNRKGFKTYAYYDPQEKKVAVYIKNRGLADICRSVAHELVHHLQNQRGDLKNGEPVQDIGGNIEDEANAVAGQLIKKFGYQHPDMNIYVI